ncbi:acyltransferase family protein [Microbacterium thalli]|uniref:Acyltransferase n=1 Tax=Microbacterium thalli TaxID=3027921 RepID=A0ABT5SMY2_9MICO|nr:acyltransferase [Microbacterium thalli]MDD7963511.1 acyltransferase [Microbacterium thalli]
MTSGADKPRSSAIDALRVGAIVAVAASHLWGEYEVVRALTFSWHVPMFFFLAGYLWTTRAADARRTTRSEIVTRFRTLVVPFAAWTTIFGVLTIGYLVSTTGVTIEGVLSTLWGGARARGPWSPYWFLPVLFFATVLYRWLEGRRIGPRLSIAIGGTAVAVCYLVGDQLALWTPQDIAIAVPMLLLLGAGSLVRRYEGLVRGRAVWGASFLLTSLVLLLVGWAAPLDMKLGDFGTPVISVAVSLLICTGLLWVALTALPGSLPGKIGDFISESARTSVVVLLTHTFAYWLLSAQLQVPRPVVFVVTVTGTIGLGVLLHRTRLSQWLVGIPTRRKS